jgi:hypothetical protein
MKRHAIALLVQPFKNRLMPLAALKESIDRFAEQLLQLGAEHPNFHFNVALPAYILECTNPLLLSRLRDMHKRDTLEWLCEGYSEPFLSFFPQSLTEDNLRLGLATFTELTGATPQGFLPPFSNWETSYISTLRRLGLSYVALSSAALPPQARSACGYWFAEHAGDAIALFPSHKLHHYDAPADAIDWVEQILARDASLATNEKFVTVHYLLPLDPESGVDPFRWLKNTVAELDKHILLYRSVLLQEARSLQPPIGLQHLPPSLPLHDAPDEPEPHYFLNRLHSFDQVGILQRKLMDIVDKVAMLKDHRAATELKHRLFFLQDINRFLPAKTSGFTVLDDRLWSYGRLIDIERSLREHDGAGGGRIEITDFLRNGNKSIIMTNDTLKVYLDYKNGAHLFELDFPGRSLNLCAALNPAPHTPPDILSPGASFTSFIDRIYAEQTTPREVIAGGVQDLGNFADGPFEYKVKKTATGVKTALSRQGSFLRGDKSCPLGMEKVFGLEKEKPTLSFVYQLANHALTACGFTFAFELAFSLPGTAERRARILHGKKFFANVGWETISLEAATKWILDDPVAGVRLSFVTQKPLAVIVLPLAREAQAGDPPGGVRILCMTPVALEPSSSWTLMGTITCKKTRDKLKESDAL